MPTCESCIYWLNNPTNPKCRYDPHYEIHSPGDWCGKHKEEIIIVILKPDDKPEPPAPPPQPPKETQAPERTGIAAELEAARKLNETLKSKRGKRQ
jgi:hypothetical protein